MSLSGAHEIAGALRDVPGPDVVSRDAAADRQARLTKPAGALGRLEELAIWLAGWQGRERPGLDRVHCLVFAGNHGVAARGVSAYPTDVTAQMVANFRAGGAAINQLCRLAGAELSVIPVELDRPTRDIVVEDAMTEAECAMALQAGVDAVPEEADLLLLGEMGIGNTTTAAALSLATFGGAASAWVGAGTGVSDAGIAHKADVINAAVERTGRSLGSAFHLLRRLGGRELAALAGAVVAARHRSIPIVLDGFVSTAAAATLVADNPAALDHALLSHLSAEAGHRRLAECLRMKPVLDLDMRLGEASGAAVCLLVLRAAVSTHVGMSTFSEAGVSTRDE